MLGIIIKAILIIIGLSIIPRITIGIILCLIGFPIIGVIVILWGLFA